MKTDRRQLFHLAGAALLLIWIALLPGCSNAFDELTANPQSKLEQEFLQASIIPTLAEGFLRRAERLGPTQRKRDQFIIDYIRQRTGARTSEDMEDVVLMWQEPVIWATSDDEIIDSELKRLISRAESITGSMDFAVGGENARVIVFGGPGETYYCLGFGCATDVWGENWKYRPGFVGSALDRYLSLGMHHSPEGPKDLPEWIDFVMTFTQFPAGDGRRVEGYVQAESGKIYKSECFIWHQHSETEKIRLTRDCFFASLGLPGLSHTQTDSENTDETLSHAFFLLRILYSSGLLPGVIADEAIAPIRAFIEETQSVPEGDSE